MAVTGRHGICGKECSTCKAWKPLTEFPPDPTHGASQGERHCRCRECHREAARQRYARQRAIIQRAKQLGLSKG